MHAVVHVAERSKWGVFFPKFPQEIEKDFGCDCSSCSACAEEQQPKEKYQGCDAGLSSLGQSPTWGFNGFREAKAGASFDVEVEACMDCEMD